jgi:hypothetical protein
LFAYLQRVKNQTAAKCDKNDCHYYPSFAWLSPRFCQHKQAAAPKPESTYPM